VTRAAPGTLARARRAAAGRDFRALLLARLASTVADGLVQAALVDSIIFAPEAQTTVAGFAIASLVVVVPYSLVGPMAGVFIDRWPRRRILILAPLVRAAPVWLVLADPRAAPVAFFAGALWVLGVNRFYLATATAVVPRLVATEDLLVANSLSTIGGTTALLAGVFVGGLVAEAAGSLPIVAAAAALWLLAAALAAVIGRDLLPHHPPDAAEPMAHAVRRVGAELADGARCLRRAPRALAPIASMSLDQLGQGLVVVLSLFVFRERFREGVGSFSWLIGAGGVGVFVGLLSVGRLELRVAKERIIALGFVVGGIALVAVAAHLDRLSILGASFAVGVTFAWKKVPSDTMVQEAVPDGYRGRVFAVYDVCYQMSRLAAAGLAVPLLPGLGPEWCAVAAGVAFLIWSPVVPRWAGRRPDLRIRFYEGAHAEEWPRAVVWGCIEEEVKVLRSWREERDGTRLRRFRLALADGTVIEVSRPEDAAAWRLDRELDR
jgi:MFS family permease